LNTSERAVLGWGDKDLCVFIIGFLLTGDWTRTGVGFGSARELLLRTRVWLEIGLVDSGLDLRPEFLPVDWKSKGNGTNFEESKRWQTVCENFALLTQEVDSSSIFVMILKEKNPWRGKMRNLLDQNSKEL
jgi:hypothetical protein